MFLDRLIECLTLKLKSELWSFLMNELQQVLLIFAVVVIAGLYFLSRSRQTDSKKSNRAQSDANNQESKANQSPKAGKANTVEHLIDVPPLANNDAEKVLSDDASKALNDLGEAHIPVSENTQKRVAQQTAENLTNPAENESVTSVPTRAAATVSSSETDVSQIKQPEVNPNQGTLFFGEDFDIEPKESTGQATHSDETLETAKVQQLESESGSESETAISETQESHEPQLHEEEPKVKHHVLVVDDPGMTGELDETYYPPEEIKPSFGIPEDKKAPKPQSGTKKEAEVFVIMVMTAGQEFPMTAVNQALLGVGLSYDESAIYVKKDTMGNAFIKVANILEPGTFPNENLDEYGTPGIALILELPTSIRAPAAMHELIMMSRKISQRLKGRLYNMERQLIKESDLQSMRDAALDYESEPLA